VVFACIATNESRPGLSIIYDTAQAIIAALKYHQKNSGPSYRTPTIIQLRSASVNPVFHDASPYVARNMAWFCFRYCYEDIQRASELYSSTATESPDLLQYIFIDPPSIHDANGTTPTGHKLILEGKQEPVVSYADLGVAFCEAAERRDAFANEAVGVTATGKVNMTWGPLVAFMFTGFKGRILG
jgi:oxidoreductase AflX